MTVAMEPALDVLNKALNGDQGARSFLDRTSSIYVLDATDWSKPHTYGCWNFIHQAMNEVERAEGNIRRNPQLANSPNASSIQFVAHVQLLAAMALRVARRSNDLDKQLLATCIANASTYSGSSQEAEKLIEINVEIRDIVMGRLAALALDPGIYQRKGDSLLGKSAFSDAVVLETFCAVLAANAISNGPTAVRHLVSEWIAPSSNHLPPFCLTCITLHLAEEASRRSAPMGTQDALQQLSSLAIARVLAPILSEAVKESIPQSTVSNGLSHRDFNSRIAALSLRAIKHWCEATELSLAQIKHICSKVGIKIVETLSDAMYSDSALVVDALAELVDFAMDMQNSNRISEQRMTQVRYIMNVEEEAFRSSITVDQLLVIESKEMTLILEELVSAIGLQRFRFVDRQAKGDHSVCRNLARMAAAVCICGIKIQQGGNPVVISPTLLDLLLKAASHPMVDICAIALEALNPLLRTTSGLAYQVLPILQGRAIAPHRFKENGNISLVSSETSGVDFSEFSRFRDTLLSESLRACWRSDESAYMTSCSAAIDEFCKKNASEQVSFHLEAAIFCLSAVVDDAIGSSGATFTSCVDECLRSLSTKPQSLLSNPLTLAQMCNLVEKTAKCVGSNDSTVLDLAGDLVLSTFNLCATEYPSHESAVEMRREGDIVPYGFAAKALGNLLLQHPKHFASAQAVAVLGVGWENAYSASNRVGILEVRDRQILCHGICHVLAILPEPQRTRSFLALAMPAQDCLQIMLGHVESNINASQSKVETILSRMASEVVIIATLASSFSHSCRNSLDVKQSELSALPTTMVEPASSLIQKCWPAISKLTTLSFEHKPMLDAIAHFMVSCIPQKNDALAKVEDIRALVELAISLASRADTSAQPDNFAPTLRLVEAILDEYGAEMEAASLAGNFPGGESNPQAPSPTWSHIYVLFENLLLSTIDRSKHRLGNTWVSTQQQGNGQSAFESESEPRIATSEVARDMLAPILFILTTSTTICPRLLCHLPAAPGQNYGEHSLLGRAVDSALPCLGEFHAPETRSAMQFIDSIVLLGKSSQESSRTVARDLLSGKEKKIWRDLLLGFCGRYESSNVDAALTLLFHMVSFSQDLNQNLRDILREVTADDAFMINDDCKAAIVTTIVRSLEGNERLASCLYDLWELHQVESSQVLLTSDQALQFCQKYRI